MRTGEPLRVPDAASDPRFHDSASLATGVSVSIENARLYESLRAREEGLRAEVGAGRRASR
ncbi:MAG: hypothetical protein P8R42_09725 [Candidatus Binatia bacterium]|nr:hypothetical protein [Candidatus Binatia bacterium]